MKKLWSLLCILSLLISPALAATESPEDAESADQPPAETVPSERAGKEPYVVPGAAYTVQAKSAMLIEMGTNQILFEQNADQQVYPASLTKVMTCMLTLEHGNLTDTITVSETALQGLSEAGSTAGLQAGELVHVIADAHIYDRHVPVIERMIENEPKAAPRFVIDRSVDDFYKFTRDSFQVEGYEYSPFAEKIPVAV